MLLNTLDLMVCFSGAITLATYNLRGLKTIKEIIQVIYLIFTESTGFTTCLLSATRCVNITLPFYKINEIGVTITTGVFIGYVLMREITLGFILEREIYWRIFAENVHLSIILGDIGLMIAVTLIVNLISMFKLLLSKDKIPDQSRAASVKATITVAILSVLFCVFNAFFMIGNALALNKRAQGFLAYFGIFYAITCNSAINPLIYLIRKKEMKEYILSLVGKKRERPDVQGASRQTSLLSTISASTLRACRKERIIYKSSVVKERRGELMKA